MPDQAIPAAILPIPKSIRSFRTIPNSLRSASASSAPAFASALALLLLISVSGASSASAQQALRGAESAVAKATPAAASAPTSVPALVPYTGFGIAADGKAVTGEVPVTFLIYKEEVGGQPLFTETQTAAFDPAGRYEVQLGATLSSGIPLDLFGSGEARWLEVQIAGAKTQPRALLVSVPYALKAGDASTLGGLPASAYALAGTSKSQALTSLATTAGVGVTPDTATAVTTTGGTSGYLPVFNGTSTVVNSSIYQGTNSVGIGHVPNAAYELDVNGKSILRGNTILPNNGNASTSAGANSFPLGFIASAYNSSSKADVGPTFYWQAEPTGNNTAAPAGTMNLLYSSNFGTGAETGFSLKSNGTINFASGQTFPGTGAGTITGVTAGTGLTGGGTSGKVTLNINPGVIPELAGTNSFTGSDTFVTSLYEDLDINIDNKNTNSGGISPGLRLGSASGEGMASKRTSGGNQYGVDLYTNYTSRLAINASGQVAIGTGDTFNGAQLYVKSSTGDGADFYAGVSGAGVQAYGSNASSNYAGEGGDFTGGTGTGINGANGLYVNGGYSDSQDAGWGVESSGANSGSGDGGVGGYFAGGGSNTGGGSYGIFAIGGQSQSNGQADAAELDGNVLITGTVTYSNAFRKMDDPVDPAAQYLSHASIESSELVNIYSGNVTTDEQGLATVQLPSWFEAANGDLRYQLTPIGQFAQAMIASEVANGKFTIRTDKTNIKVSWQITGVRQDAYSKAHPLVAEQTKGVREQGFYLHPELYGQPAQKQVEWAIHPGMMKKIAQHAERNKQALAAKK